MNDIYMVTRQFFRNYLRNGQTVVPQQWRNPGNCCFRHRATVSRTSPLTQDNSFDCFPNNHELIAIYIISVMMNNVRMRRDFQNVTMSTIYDWICVIWRELAKKHTHNARLQVHVNSPGHVLPRAGFAEERVVRFVAIVHHVWLVTDQVTIWVNSVLQTVKFPACIAHLYPSLAHVNRYAFPLEKNPKFIRGKNKQILVHVMPFISIWQTQTQCVRYITCGSSLS